MTDPASKTHLLEVQNLSLHYRTSSGTTPILHDIAFSLDRGEVVGLIGESGAGKSTVGNAILDLLAPELERTSGAILIAGEDLKLVDRRDRDAIRRRRISAIFQDHTSSLDPLMTIGAQIEETIRAAHLKLPRKDVKHRAIELLERVGIDDPAGRLRDYPHQFSGGQRQRVVIAIALAGSPDIIIADEPTSALDATVQKQILELLRKLVDETGISIILVTHDMGVIAQIADRVVVMRHGQVAEQNVVSEVLERPQSDYTRKLLAAVPKLRISGSADVASCSNRSMDPETTIAGEGIAKTFPSRGPLFFIGKSQGKCALRDISVRLERGAITGVVGESGSGKSTLGRLLAGLDRASAGEFRIGEDAFDASRSGARSGLLGRVQMIFQDPAVSLNPRMTIEKTLLESARYGGRAVRGERDDVGAMMDRVGLTRGLLGRYPHQLSGGQKQRVAIARALLAKPEIVVADEPTSALDVSVQAEVIHLLKEVVAEQHVTMMFISHDLAVVQDLCSFVYVLKDGQMVDSGSSDFIFMHSQHPYTRSLIEARPRHFIH
ncbi:UNVERIFIED_ORG: peptide/nickel transport system ATP-binding protein [Agrobacterium larrymoorei]|uniref:Peptide ABC transporter ATP-binding protein n=2 Tax=Rhizobium/Agrobacterium group TaxID=227290 RepID=A0AA92BZ37_RHIRH|nr:MULTISPECIES: ABC transporter ATP-binding protein [Rhizobium/Agrobacterium group]MDP9573815.1 peptide/nickel transport system ATP-binding protein [Agrobacterium larrymoorei]PVE62594.1 peptide ABC transporter ATP-binding protein [Agrobacterium tumefaciens]PVE70732.1 peptide ABC transporter ATP-binding protein [Sphingomonas sp. TPD3009]PVE50145.1 peptide ABC transporter ATP-binding protein [Rhizobium rhizogenes]TBN14806.1 ABC transporter ATP-binding protein [Agrobacterium cavarae]